jgi:hypothetical protein
MEGKSMKRFLTISVLGAMLAAGGVALAKDKHTNLTAAHHAIEQAEKKLAAAEAANEFDLDGHAKKAKELLQAALHEVHQARETANKKK